MLNRYRSNPDFIPELDFVMEIDGKIIGHVMYSKAGMTNEQMKEHCQMLFPILKRWKNR